jgi:transcription antitermination factor NusG
VADFASCSGVRISKQQRRNLISTRALHWYAIRVKSNRERVTADSLKGKGLEVFLPEYRSQSRKNTRRSSSLPLFAGYLFCRFDPLNRLPILMVPGVVHIVGFGKDPEPVDPEEMSRLFALTECQLELEPHPYPPVGEHIRLQNGPLRGIDGIILAHEGEDRLVVSVTLLQRSVAVQIERDWLAPLELEVSTPSI